MGLISKNPGIEPHTQMLHTSCNKGMTTTTTNNKDFY